VGGLTVLVVFMVGVTVWALQQDEEDESSASTAADAEPDAERGTTTSQPRTTTTASRRSTTTSIGSVLFADQLEPGQCFDDSSFTSSAVTAGQITAADCAAPHDAEVYKVLDMGFPPGEPYPSEDQIIGLGDAICEEGFAGYVGIAYLDSQWEYGYYMPSEESWTKYDDRRVVCYLAAPLLNKLEGSKQNSMT
jgi:Septum formation